MRINDHCASPVYVPVQTEGHQKIDQCHSLIRNLLGAVWDYVLFKLVINK